MVAYVLLSPYLNDLFLVDRSMPKLRFPVSRSRRVRVQPPNHIPSSYLTNSITGPLPSFPICLTSAALVMAQSPLYVSARFAICRDPDGDPVQSCLLYSSIGIQRVFYCNKAP